MVIPLLANQDLTPMLILYSYYSAIMLPLNEAPLGLTREGAYLQK